MIDLKVVVILKRYLKPSLVLCLLVFTVLFVSGCSLSTLSSKVFGEKVTATIPAEYVHIDEQGYTQAVTALIKSAKKSIYIEQYSFDRKDYMDLLIAQAKQGVEIKVLLDTSVKGNKDTYDYLRANGVSVQYYPTQKGQQAHAKLITVDNTRSIIGGIDWNTSANQNHDVGLELDGRSGRWVARVFAKDWTKATTNDVNVPSETDLPDDHILLATNDNIKSVATKLIQDSKLSIQIELTQLSDPDLLGLLADFAASGKQVQVILDPTWEKSNQTAVDKLKSSGAAVRNYPASDTRHQYARFAVFDGSTSLISTANWARSAFVMNHEIAAQIPSKAIAEKLSAQFAADWKISQDAQASSVSTTPQGANSQANTGQ